MTQPTILLTGANGQVGFEMRRTLAPHGHVTACDRSMLDLGDRDALVNAVRALKPQLIVNAAAYTGTFREEIIYAGGYPQDAYNWWMNDPVHHDAILDPKNTEMGVGYAYVSTSTYGGYFTVDFGSR